MRPSLRADGSRELLRRFALRNDGKCQLIAVVLAVKQIPVFGANAGKRLRNS